MSAVSAKRDDHGPRVELVELREHRPEPLEVAAVVALSRLELRQGEMDEWGHERRLSAKRWIGSTARTPRILAGTTVHGLESRLMTRISDRSFRSSARRRVLAVLAGARAVTAQDTAHRPGEAWQIIPLPQSSLVFARDGSLIGEIGREMRTSVPTQVAAGVRRRRRSSPSRISASTSTTAWTSSASPARSRARSSRKNRGGASTITQQLVGYMHPDIIDRREISGTPASRKLHEQAAAREMEKHYTKEQILEAYINQINLGRGWYGVDAGARHYFGHPAAQLTLAEAATLAGTAEVAADSTIRSRIPARAKGAAI